MKVILGVMLANVSSTQYAQQGIYSEIVSAGQVIVPGGCNSWEAEVFSAPLYLATLKVKSIVFSQKTFELTRSLSTQSCESNATAVVLALGTLSTDAINTPCDGHNWVSRSCNSAPALCVDCKDPCQQSCSPDALNPCNSRYSSCPPLVQDMIRVFAVNFLQPFPAPAANISSIIPLRTTITVYVNLAFQGTVYAAAVPTLNPSITRDQVLLQNHQAISKLDSAGNNVAMITIAGLNAATQYSVYILTQSVAGALMSTSDMIASRLDVSTLCCRTVYVSMASVSLYQGQGLASAVSISIDTRPDHNITTKLTLRSQSTSQSTNLIPAVVRFLGAGAAAMAATASIGSASTSQPGVFSLSVAVFGPDAALYSVTYSSGSLLTVLSANEAPPTPVLLSVRFSSDGSSLEVSFDSPTNQASMSTSAFPCSSLFAFSGVDSGTRCQWTSSTTVTIGLGPTATLALNAPVKLLGGMVQAACPSSIAASVCSGWTTSQETLLPVLPPLVPVIPTVVVSAPSTIGICTALTLDLSASTGSGGRSWANITFNVNSLTGNTLGVAEFLSRNYITSPPTAIPGSLLSSGTYSFSVQLCSFLGECGTQNAVVTVLDQIIPLVTIFGPTVLTVHRGDELSVAADAYVSVCNSTTVQRSDINLIWTVLANGVNNPYIVSTSRQTSMFLLPAFTLSVNTLYTIQLQGMYTVSHSTALTSIQVFVEQGSLVALVAGGTRRGVRLGGNVSIDASDSYDPDQLAVTGSAAGLLYSWSCMQSLPVLLSTCPIAVAGSDHAEVLVLVATDGSLGTVSAITGTVYDLTRTTTVSLTVSVLAADAPLVTVDAVGVTSKVNPAQKLAIAGSIE